MWDVAFPSSWRGLLSSVSSFYELFFVELLLLVLPASWFHGCLHIRVLALVVNIGGSTYRALPAPHAVLFGYG